MLNKICTRADSYRQAKTTPYPPCTVTVFWPIGTDLWRRLRRVTLTKLYRRAVTCQLLANLEFRIIRNLSPLKHNKTIRS